MSKEKITLMAYEGNSTCTSWLCRRFMDGIEGCIGWHCAVCDEPSNQYGHPECREQAKAEP